MVKQKRKPPTHLLATPFSLPLSRCCLIIALVHVGSNRTCTQSVSKTAHSKLASQNGSLGHKEMSPGVSERARSSPAAPFGALFWISGEERQSHDATRRRSQGGGNTIHNLNDAKTLHFNKHCVRQLNIASCPQQSRTWRWKTATQKIRAHPHPTTTTTTTRRKKRPPAPTRNKQMPWSTHQNSSKCTILVSFPLI